MQERSIPEAYEYSPTQKEAYTAMRQQALISLRFHTDPKMTVEEYQAQLEAALAPLKRSKQTVKYTLQELSVLAQNPKDKKSIKLFAHEGKHAAQLTRALKAMGIHEVPEFIVYYCPIMADMYQYGNGVGLLETQGLSTLSRERQIELERRLAREMLKTTDSSIGDIYIIGAMIFAKLISLLHK